MKKTIWVLVSIFGFGNWAAPASEAAASPEFGQTPVATTPRMPDPQIPEPLSDPSATQVAEDPADGVSGESIAEEYAVEETPISKFSLHYFGILYGPALSGTSSYQPLPSGDPDLLNPVVLRNYASVMYEPNEYWVVAATAYWHWEPVLGQRLSMRDPFVRVGRDQLISGGGWDLYADLRVHFAVSDDSRQSDMLGALQLYEALTFETGRFTFGTYGSARAAYFGRRGSGYDLELYLGPHMYYQIRDDLKFTLLYEMAANHIFGDKPFQFTNDGTDLEPGLAWDVTPDLTLHPYLNFFPGDVSLKSTSVGMMLSWKML